MTDLVSKIADLQAQFQHIADRHDWVCLAMPPWGRGGVPTIGELVRPSPPPPEPVGNILDASGQPIPISKPSLLEKAEYAKAVRSIRFSDEHGRDRDPSIEEVVKAIQQIEYLNSYQGMVELHGPPPWVLVPEDLRRVRVTEHVTVLTDKANRLLFSVLDGPNQVCADIQEHIRERERKCSWWGWVAWLRYYGFVNGPTWRIEGYPQVAATALMGLRDLVGAKMEVLKPSNAVATGTSPGVAAGNDLPRAVSTAPPNEPPDLNAVIAAVVDENAVAIIRIASDATKTTDQKMREIYAIDSRALGWDSPKWAAVLSVSDAMIRKTEWWKADRLRLRG